MFSNEEPPYDGAAETEANFFAPGEAPSGTPFRSPDKPSNDVDPAA